jgi:phage terminase large subunit
MDAVDRLVRWTCDALAFVRECLHADPDPGQADALTEVSRSPRLALMASKGTGKTTCCAWIIWWFLLTRPYARIAVTSVSEDSLNDTLWPELALWQSRSPLLQQCFTWNKTRISAKESPETWFVTARTWPKQADPQRQAETLAGLHADHILFVLDESGSIPQAVMGRLSPTSEQSSTNLHAKSRRRGSGKRRRNAKAPARELCLGSLAVANLTAWPTYAGIPRTARS